MRQSSKKSYGIRWGDKPTRDRYDLDIPVDDWTWEECMDWLVSEGIHTCTSEYLTHAEAIEEVRLQAVSLNIDLPTKKGQTDE